MAYYRPFLQAFMAPLCMGAGILVTMNDDLHAVVKPRQSPHTSTLDRLGGANKETPFPKPAIVRKQVRFWEKIFYTYPSTTVIVHDPDNPDKIIDVIDYKLVAKDQGKQHPALRKERDEITKKYLKRYTKAVDRFRRFGNDARKFGAIEQRLYTVYRTSPQALARLFAGNIKLRAQTGLADDFSNAFEVAQSYMPYMERVFHSYGIPTQITRLPFVESMFNLKARSKVGASGLWQFMPATARSFIYVNDMVDERNCPFKATRAAASFLAGNYRSLQSWPLAITAYNHGKVGMERAVKQVGSSDIDAVIQRYQSPSFGFASKNFYAEFLAASATYERLERQGRKTNGKLVPDTEAIILSEETTIAQILRHTPITREILERHNPCLLEKAYTTDQHKPLPPFYEIRVPREMAQAFKTALQDVQGKRYAKG